MLRERNSLCFEQTFFWRPDREWSENSDFIGLFDDLEHQKKFKKTLAQSGGSGKVIVRRR
jgi:hypothetical protein